MSSKSVVIIISIIKKIIKINTIDTFARSYVHKYYCSTYQEDTKKYAFK